MAKDLEAVFLSLPRRDAVPKARPQTQRSYRPLLNYQVLLTAVLKEQRIYLKHNKYAQELEDKYWHPRIKSLEDPVALPAPPAKAKEYPVNDRGFTLNLKHKFDSVSGVRYSCPRLKSAPGAMRRHEVLDKLRKMKGHLVGNCPQGPGLPVKVFSPSKGALFTKYSKVSLQPRPYTAGRVDKHRSTAVIIPRQVLLDVSPATSTSNLTGGLT